MKSYYEVTWKNGSVFNPFSYRRFNSFECAANFIFQIKQKGIKSVWFEKITEL